MSKIFCDDIICELYISETSLRALECQLNGYADFSTWPFDFYELVMIATDEFYDKRDEAILKLGEKEVDIQYAFFKTHCGES